MAIKSFGVGVTVNAIAIGGLTDVMPQGVEVNNIDITTHDSAGYREFIGGLIDGGTLELTGKYDQTDAGQLELQDEVGNTHPVVITFSDSSTRTFSAVVGGFNLSNALDDAIEFTCSLKVTGAITAAP